MFCMTHGSSPLLSSLYQNFGWRLPHQRPKVSIDTLLHLGEELECAKGWSKFLFPHSLSLCFPKLTQTCVAHFRFRGDLRKYRNAFSTVQIPAL